MRRFVEYGLSRSRSLLVGIGLGSTLLLIAAVPAARSDVISNERIPVEFELTTSCNPENVLTLTGFAHEVTREDPVGGHSNVHGTATDSAGNEYVLNYGGNYHGDPYSPPPEKPGAVVNHFTGHGLVVQKGETGQPDDEQGVGIYHEVITPSGKLLFISQSRSRCH